MQLDTITSKRYIGRFAPSPTGPLHYGSLIAAVASFLDARHNHGLWLLRIEDLDPPRESPEAPDEIMRQLEAFSLTWDGEVLFQSSRLQDYEDALYSIRDHTFCCVCSRKSTPHVYPGTCRDENISKDVPFAIRLKVPDEVLETNDRICGVQRWDLENDVGDFIIKRKDGLFAYQLAVVVDDVFQGVTHVVRGRDLLNSTPRQIALYRAFGKAIPHYAHFPIVVDSQHAKLSKQAHAKPVLGQDPLEVLKVILRQLSQDVPNDVDSAPELLQVAAENWDISAITSAHMLPEPRGIHESQQT